MPEQLLHGGTTDLIIKSFYHVYNSLGYGFLEKVYENALRVSLTKAGLAVDQQWPIAVEFEGEKVGDYFADLTVGDSVIVEIKADKAFAPEHEAQLVNYLKATRYQVGLLLRAYPRTAM